MMKIVSFIEDEEVIEKILKHLGLWDLKVRPPPKVKAPSVTIPIDYSDSQISFADAFPHEAPPIWGSFFLDTQRPFFVYSTHPKECSYQYLFGIFLQKQKRL